LQHNDCSTATHEVNVNDDEQLTTVTTPRSTPKRKNKITSYLNDDDESDSQKFILINQSIKYKTLNQLARKVLTVPAT
ncbi:unnamed protein product, partial [Rotaria sp. Silwood1]